MGRKRRRNPEGLETVTQAVNLAMIAGVAFVGYKAATGPLRPFLKSIGIDLGGDQSGDGAGWTPVSPPGAPPQCHPYPHASSSHLDMVVGDRPPRQQGYPVAFRGRLYGDGLLTGQLGYGGRLVEFWQPSNCDGYFDSVMTDNNGDFILLRPLHDDELEGYYVYARYSGGGNILATASPAQTGTWRVVPQ